MASGGYISTGQPASQFFNTEEEMNAFIAADFNPGAFKGVVWFLLNKESLQTLLNLTYNASQTVPSNDRNSVLVSLPPRDSGINSRIEEKADYSGNVREAEPQAGSLSLNIVRVSRIDVKSYLANVYKILIEAGSQISASLVLRILTDLNAGSITDQIAVDRLNKIDFSR